MSKESKKKRGFGRQRIDLNAPRGNPSYDMSCPNLSISRYHKSCAPKIQGYHCIDAWEIKNSPSKRASFDQAVFSIGNVQTLYHGTPHRNIDSIAREGLRPGSRFCMFGPGIYLGDPGKAILYGGPRYGSRAEEHSFIFEVRVVLGKVWEQERSSYFDLDIVESAGYNSVGGIKGKTRSWRGTLNHTEYVVYSSAQVLPTRIFEYAPTVAETTYYGACQILKENQNFISTGNKAFTDILNETPCGKTGAVRLRTTDKTTVVICKKCFEALKLKKGSKVRIFPDSNYHRREKVPIVVTLTGDRW